MYVHGPRKCVLCGHVNERWYDDRLPVVNDGQFRYDICGACIKTYRPDSMLLIVEFNNAEHPKTSTTDETGEQHADSAETSTDKNGGGASPPRKESSGS